MITVRTGPASLKPPAPAASTPDPNTVRAACPLCGAPLVSELKYRPGLGYIIFWECAGEPGAIPVCTYSRVL